MGRRSIVCSVVLFAGLIAIGLAALSPSARGQCPVDPDKCKLVMFDGDTEVGRVYRDVAGSRYVEHWVLYPWYSFDRAERAGESIQIEVVGDGGYESVEDFLRNVPFPKGSRYVIAACQEFDSLPVGD